jgi:hypothetical protein
MDLKHIHPDDVTPDGVRLPRFVVRIAQTRSPAREYYRLQTNFAELMPYAVRDEPIPLSVIETLPEPDDEAPAMTSQDAERFRVALASETHRHKEAVTRLAAAERDRDRYKKALHAIDGLCADEEFESLTRVQRIGEILDDALYPETTVHAGHRVKITSGSMTLWGDMGQLLEVKPSCFGDVGRVKLDSGPTIRVPMSALEIL